MNLFTKQKQTGGCLRWEVGEMGEESQKIQTSSYKMNKSWGFMYNMVTIVNTVLHI